MESVVVSSEFFNAELAIKDVITKLKNEMPNPSAILIFTEGRFGAPEHAAEEVYNAFECPMIGCSTCGGTTKVARELDQSIILIGLKSNMIKFSTGVIKDLSGSMDFETKDPVTDPGLCLIFPDALSTNTSPIIECMQQKLGAVPIVGAFPADNWTFDNTLQYIDGCCIRDAAPFMLFDGPIDFQTETAHGWHPVSDLFEASNVDGHIVSRIGDKSAYEFYHEIIGDESLFGEFPLRFEMDDCWVMRAPLNWDREIGTVSFGANIPIGAMVSLVSTTKKDLIGAARESAILLDHKVGERDGLWLSLSCAGRKQHLSSRAINERDAFLNDVVQQPCAMLYVYGEILPSPQFGAIIQNQSIIHLYIGEQ